MSHWYDYVFWAFFGGGILFIVTIIIRLLVDALRKPKPFVSTYDPTANRSTSSDEDREWGVGGTDSSTGMDSGGGWND
ncbi:MAG TPA: hypothetical protein VKB93_09200 [Thermoanaerobaculia bacterium]|nr:hypothetical protein [Thermoanaerobaculia bacterium]